MRRFGIHLLGCLTLALCGCGGGDSKGTEGNGHADAGGDAADGSGGGSRVKYVFVIAMENHDADHIYGNTTSAPYINGTLLPGYASASNFVDTLPIAVPSEPHYVWMEAGTNVFPDHTFTGNILTGDEPPSATNSTSSTDHLVTQMKTANVEWLAYQEGIDDTSGACPIAPSGYYQPKHDPFIFFQDVSGNPPSKTNEYCASHHKPLTELAGDLANKSVARYNFITPDQCHDMHGQPGCDPDLIKPADDWLAATMPDLIAFSEANAGAIFIVWDEGEGSPLMPFIAVGPGVKKNYVSDVELNHSGLVKSVEEIFQLPVLPSVETATDFADMFEAGSFP